MKGAVHCAHVGLCQRTEEYDDKGESGTDKQSNRWLEARDCFVNKDSHCASAKCLFFSM